MTKSLRSGRRPKGNDFKYLDSSSESIESYLNESFEFIEKALESDEAVFVHWYEYLDLVSKGFRDHQLWLLDT